MIPTSSDFFTFLPPEQNLLLANQLHFPFKTESGMMKEDVCSRRQAIVHPQGCVRLSIRTPSLPQKGFLGCSALVTHTLISHALGGMRCSWVLWQGFIAGETQSPIHMNNSRPWNCFVLSGASLSVPKSLSCVLRPDWMFSGRYINIFYMGEKKIMSLLYAKLCLATDL